MKKNKLISLLCAMAIAVSAFAGITVTASADAEHSVKITVDSANKKSVTVTSDEAAADFAGVLIHASYNGEGGALKSVKVYNVEHITNAAEPVLIENDAETGDKLFVWNSLQGMVPYGILKVTAPEQPTTHTVTFDVNGGTGDIPSQTVNDGETAARPETNPTRDGYTFAGWFIGDTHDRYDFDTPVTTDLTLKANWSVIEQPIPTTHTVTFDANGGSAVASQTVNDGQTAQKPADPTKSGYTFVEWQYNGAAYNFSTPVTGDITLTAKYKVNTPSIAIDYVNEKLTGFEEGNYTINGTNAAISENKADIDSGYFNTTIKIVKKGSGSDADSDEQPLVIKARPAAPAVVTTQPNAIGGKGTISGLTTDMEYKKKGTQDAYTVSDGTNIAAAAGEVYLVRYKAVAGTSFASADTETEEITEFAGAKETIPASSVTVNFIAETITGFEAGKEYTITYLPDDAANPSATETDNVAAADTSVSATKYIGKQISIVKKGNGTTTTDSDAYALTVDARPAVELAIDNLTESVTIPAGYSYGAAAENLTSTDVEKIETVAAEASIYVQKDATNSAFKSAVKQLTAPARAASPNVTVKSYADETLNTTADMEYNYNGEWKAASADMPITTADFGYGNGAAAATVTFRTKATAAAAGNAGSYASLGADATIPARPAAPTVSTTPANEGQSDGAITGVDTTMEYISAAGLENNQNWTAVTGTSVTGLASGTYYVRVAAAANAFAGVRASATVGVNGKVTITFMDGDGHTVLHTDHVNSGDTPSYTGSATPAKEADAKYTYAWDNTWTPAFAAVTTDTTYTPNFTPTAKSYDINYVVNSGTLTGTYNAEYTYSPSATTALATSDNISREGYTFGGWYDNAGLNGEAVTAVPADTTGVKTYYAKWTPIQYTITWKIGDTETPETYSYGAEPSYKGETPAKASTAQYSYTFKEWSPAIANVTGNRTYTATFNEILRTYTVTWKDYDETVLETDNDVPYGTTPTYDSATPTRASTASTDYTFNTWTPAVGAIEGDTTYTASYTESARTYKATFNLNGGTGTAEAQDVAYNGTAQAPADPTKTGYDFSGWSPALTTQITEATEFTAQWTAHEYTITYNNADGASTIADADKKYTIEAEKTLPPITKEHYTFDGWYTASEGGDKVETIAEGTTGDKTYYAHWTINKNNVTFNLNYENASEAEVVAVDYNTKVTKPSDPERQGFTFAGWHTDAAEDSAFDFDTAITAATQLYAHWTEDTVTVSYTVVPALANGDVIGDTVFKQATDVEAQTQVTADKLPIAVSATVGGETKYYVLKDNDVTNYAKTFTLGADETQTLKVTYELDNEIVFYAEGEDTDVFPDAGGTSGTDKYEGDQYSKGAAMRLAKTRGAGAVLGGTSESPTLYPAGIYEIETFAAANGKATTVKTANGQTTIATDLFASGVTANSKATASFALSAESSLSLYDGGGYQMFATDYIILRYKEALPEYEVVAVGADGDTPIEEITAPVASGTVAQTRGTTFSAAKLPEAVKGSDGYYYQITDVTNHTVSDNTVAANGKTTIKVKYTKDESIIGYFEGESWLSSTNTTQSDGDSYSGGKVAYVSGKSSAGQAVGRGTAITVDTAKTYKLTIAGVYVSRQMRFKSAVSGGGDAVNITKVSGDLTVDGTSAYIFQPNASVTDNTYTVSESNVKFDKTSLGSIGSCSSTSTPGIDYVIIREVPEAPVTTYDVTFNLNGGNISGSEDAVVVTTDESGKLAEASVPSPVKDGFTLAGWSKLVNEAADYANAAAVAAETFEANTPLYAVWEAEVIEPTTSIYRYRGTVEVDSETTVKAPLFVYVEE